MSNRVADTYESDTVRKLVQRLDDYAFQAALSDDAAPPAREDLVELRVAALLAVEHYFNDLRGRERSTQEPQKRVGLAFDQWLRYVEAIERVELPEHRDILLLISTGLLADRQVELRQMLGGARVREKIANTTFSDDWYTKVRSAVLKATFCLARQSDRSDLEAAKNVLTELKAAQPGNEAEWLATRDNKEQSALSLLALYHLASAADTLTQYLMVGSVTTPLGRIGSAQNELKVLIGKAEEYADLSSDIELRTWVQAVAVSLECLRSDAIWANAQNISGTIDRFLKLRTESGRPVFSMLPSQQEALRLNFLDAQREAVVLQMPTSSGKTLLAELAALQAISSYDDARVIYLTPTRALSTQVRRTLGADFREMGIEVVSAAGAFEEDPYELSLLQQASGVVVSTPEKMDMLLRSHGAWFEKVRLLIVDEAHLLRDGERGARLELLLANFRREHPHIRILLLTPFVENAQEMADWLSGARGASVDVHWRPSRLIVGIGTVRGRKGNKKLRIEWKEPHRDGGDLSVTTMALTEGEEEQLAESGSARTRTVILSQRLVRVGPVLGMFPASRVQAEKAAKSFAEDQSEVDLEASTPEHRVAVALADAEYGEDSALSYCLRRGVSYHHSALSNELRYLVERLAATGKLSFVAATTTLAQGMNFPVSSVVIHSVSKPLRGSLTPAEFWNIAGRAGRVGLSERGHVVFANQSHRNQWEHYTEALSERIDSALDDVLDVIRDTDSIKYTYRKHEPIRPFVQYLSHAAATLGLRNTSSELERLVEASFSGRAHAKKVALLKLARRYLNELATKSSGYLKAADRTGLGSFSFDELYAQIRADKVLLDGNPEVLKSERGLKHLVDALSKLPELSLALEKGEGTINTELVAKVIHEWINGSSIAELSPVFPGEAEADRIRKAGTYVFGKVSQTVSWGVHAYLRGQAMAQNDDNRIAANRMLPAYIQYGVSSPEAVVASILGIPRPVATGIADTYRERHGELQPHQAGEFRETIEHSDVDFWRRSIERTALAGRVRPEDVRYTWREAQGLS